MASKSVAANDYIDDICDYLRARERERRLERRHDFNREMEASQ